MVIRHLTHKFPNRYRATFFTPFARRNLVDDNHLFGDGILITRNPIQDIFLDYLKSTSQGSRLGGHLLEIIISYLPGWT
jgi:hypothetical protein